MLPFKIYFKTKNLIYGQKINIVGKINLCLMILRIIDFAI